VKPQAVSFSSRKMRDAWWNKIRVHKPGFDVLTIICLFMLTMHVLVELTGGVQAHQSLYDVWFGLKAESLLAGKFWQLMTYGFLHGNWFHLVSNLAMIWLLGGRLMQIVGQKRVLMCILLGCVLGGVFFVGFDLWSGRGALLVGASGSAFALLLLMARLSPNTRFFPLPLRARNLANGMLVASLILALCQPGIDLPLLRSVSEWMRSLEMESVFMVAHACHLGGGLAGFWMAMRVFGRMISLDDLRRARID